MPSQKLGRDRQKCDKEMEFLKAKDSKPTPLGNLNKLSSILKEFIGYSYDAYIFLKVLTNL